MSTEFDAMISQQQRDCFVDEGYMILEGIMPQDYIDMLREECSYFIGYMDSRFDAGLIGEGALSQRGSRYFINDMYRYSHRLRDFLFSELMAAVCRATIGQNAVLFNEQWVVKGAEQGMHFAWHQDSGYVKAVDPDTRHPPYVTCWCALDDIHEDNGTVYLLPHSRGGTKGNIITHRRDEANNDLIGYDGDDPGLMIEVPAGSIVCFSSYNLHRSGENRTDRMRRVYLPQYASTPIINGVNGERLNLAVPFLENGDVVYDRTTDTGANWGGADPAG